MLRNASTPSMEVVSPRALVTVPPINAACSCSGVGLVMPASLKSRLASVSDRSTSPFPMCPVGGVNVTGSPAPVRVTALPSRSPCRRFVVLEAENAEVLVSLFLVEAVVVAPAEPVVVALVSVLLSPTMLLLPVIVVPPLVVPPPGVVLTVAPLMKKVRSFIAVALAVLVLVAVAPGALEPVAV